MFFFFFVEEESDASPPKREKTHEECATPSHLMKSLKINSPTQDNDEKENKDETFTPKRLFNNTGMLKIHFPKNI